MRPLRTATPILASRSFCTSCVYRSHCEKFIRRRASWTSFAIIHDAGGIRLYHGHRVFSEWQFWHER